MTGPLSTSGRAAPAGMLAAPIIRRAGRAAAVLIAGDPGRIDRHRTWLRVVTGVVIAFITLADLLAAVRGGERP